jgi:NADH-quinone oxidoreductase subunit N
MIVDYTVILPPLIVALTAMVLILADLYPARTPRHTWAGLAILSMLVAYLVAFAQHDTDKSGVASIVSWDGYAIVAGVVLVLVAAILAALALDTRGLERLGLQTRSRNTLSTVAIAGIVIAFLVMVAQHDAATGSSIVDLKANGGTMIVFTLLLIAAVLAGVLADNRPGLDRLYSLNEQRRPLAYIAISGMAIALIAVLVLRGEHKVGFYGSVVLDGFALFAYGVFLIAGILALLLSLDYLELEHINLGEYYVLVLGAIAGMMLMVAANNLIVIFLALETFSICLYVLAGFERTRERSQEAALKYFLLSAFASGFLLYGMALTYGATGSTGLPQIAAYLKAHASTNDPILIAGMALMIVGFAFKMSAVPFHTWTPDVYEGSPTPVTAMMSVGTKLAAFAAFVRLFGVALPVVHVHWEGIVWLLAVITMVGGNVAAVVQTNVKRMLAYSSIAHAGYLLIAVFTARGDGSSGDGVPSLLFYFIVYTFMNIGAFAVVAAIGQTGEENTYLHDFAGLGVRKPWLAAAMAVFLLSLAGFPPLAGFWAKFYVFSTALQDNHGELAVIGVLCSVVSVYYYFRVIYYMYFRPSGESAPVFRVPPALGIALGVCVAGSVVLGFWPSGVLTLAQNALLLH